VPLELSHRFFRPIIVNNNRQLISVPDLKTEKDHIFIIFSIDHTGNSLIILSISNLCGFFYGNFFDRGNVKQYKFSVLIERDEDGYLVGTVPSLKSCYTQAKSMEELMPRIREVIELCLQEEDQQQWFLREFKRSR